MQPTYFVKHPDDSYSEANPQPISPEKIDEMVNRFLCWKLPKDFGPDAGISFKPTKPYEGDELGNSWWPVGTNLLTADQARQMIKHLLGDSQTPNV